jgi:hypothetical protein
MVDKSIGVSLCPGNTETLFLQVDHSVLMLEMPDVEEIARVIWQRQHEALGRDAISHNIKWRDQSIPAKFWDEFLLDAHAVLLLLQNKHIEYRKMQA